MIIIHICICRFFSMTWVLMCHTYGIYELTIPVNNMTEIYDVSLEILCPGGLVLHFVNVYVQAIKLLRLFQRNSDWNFET